MQRKPCGVNCTAGRLTATLWALFLGLFTVLCLPAQAQTMGDAMAGMDAMDTMNQQPVGGGGAGQVGLNRARNAAGQAPPGMMPPGAPPGGMGGTQYGPRRQGGVSQFGGPGGQLGPAPAPGMGGGQGYAPAPTPTPTPEPTFTAIEGQRIYDAVTVRLAPDPTVLEDPRRFQITEDEKSQFYDDGQTGGDQEANDGIFSNIVTSPNKDEYMGGLSFYYLTKTINMVSAAQSMDPLEFFGLSAITNERFSTVEKRRLRVAERDGHVYKVNESGLFEPCWSKEFLDLYRKNQGDPESAFFDLYVPKPPAPPAGTPPQGWVPAQALSADRALEMALAELRESLIEEEGLSESEADARIEALFEKYSSGDLSEEDASQREELLERFGGAAATGGGGGFGALGPGPSAGPPPGPTESGQAGQRYYGEGMNVFFDEE